MIAGVGGELLPQMFLEHELLKTPADDAAVAFERALHRWWRRVTSALGPASGLRAIADVAALPLVELLGHSAPALGAGRDSLIGALASSDAALLVLPWATAEATAGRAGVRLALDRGASWVLTCNGRSLQIIDASRPWNRAAVTFDFDALIAGRRGVTVLWRLAGVRCFTGTGSASLRGRVVAADAWAGQVCDSLSGAVLDQLPGLAGALAEGGATARNRRAALDQALTLVYRLLFLLFAEARGLVPITNEIYRDAYTIGTLARRAAESTATRGLWTTIQAISRLAHAGCSAGDLQVTAFNGRLFAPRHAPLIARRKVPDRVARDLLLALATQSTGAGRRFISYHDLGVEQLGSVYERVLEHEPSASAGTFVLARTSTQRKTSGSFYTPRSLTDYLVQRTLDPLLAGRRADEILNLRVLDPAMGSGAFLVAACRYLAERCERAYEAEGRWHHDETTDADRATLRRTIAEQCLYGVDVSATAVQLARLSLWLTTLAADRPLTFLDHHLAVGNSIVGARLSDLVRPPRVTRRRTGTAQFSLFDDRLSPVIAGTVLPARWQLSHLRSDSLDAVRTKERTLANLSAPDGPLARWSRAADAWCGAALSQGPGHSSALVQEWIAAETRSGTTTLPPAQLRESAAGAQAIAREHSAFHWEFAFPEIFFDATGRPAAGAGFDAVIGNPPWEMMRADTGSPVDRDNARDTTAATVAFSRRSGVFACLGTGHPNRYQLFLERALQLTRPGGRVGLLLPSGIATDQGSAALRRHLFDRTTVDTWTSFTNRKRIFPIHRSMRFLVVATTTGGRTEQLTLRCGLADPGVLHRPAPEHGVLTIARSRIEAWSPDHLSIPDIPSATALGILARVADRIPALGDATGWSARFGRELNATEDRPHFHRRASTDGLLPVIEGKHLSPFAVDVEAAPFGIAADAAASLLDGASTFRRARIGYRDVASATNRLTLIAAMLPAGAVSTHTVFCLKTALDEPSQWCLLALLNSLVANYLVRLRVTTHVTASVMTGIPVPRPPAGSAAFDRLVVLARRLSHRTDQSDVDFASLNAIAARLYGLTSEEYAHVVDTFPLLPPHVRERCLIALPGRPPTLSTARRASK